MRKVDITDKLSFEGNPALVIKGKELEVNADAPTMLKIMNIINNEITEVELLSKAYDLIFPDKSRKEIEKMKLSTLDWTIVVQEAMELILGGVEAQKE